jgi:phosphate starvation-inducible protein PhoH and related proteins
MSKSRSKGQKQLVKEISNGEYSHSAFKPRDEWQKKAVETIINNPVSFLYGVAGTGKTTVAVGCALRLLSAGEIDKIVITRPYVTAGEKLGYLPGTLEEKFDPFITPVRMIADKLLGKATSGRYFTSEKIMILPLAYMRGLTFERSIVIVDEAQNSTTEQMHLVLTRLGHNSKIVIAGDEFQLDLEKGKSGLSDAIRRLNGMEGIGFFEFPPESCQRHHLVAKIDTKYKEDMAEQAKVSRSRTK